MVKNLHTIDATKLPLGRLASRVASLLRGKDVPNFTPHLDPGATVKVINASAIFISGRKFNDKIYHRHSGYPGNQKIETVRQVVGKKGNPELIRRAVRGMLPANRWRTTFLKRLIIED